MIVSEYKEFIGMQEVNSKDEEFNCWAYITKDKEYYLAYQPKQKEDGMYIANEPIEKDKIDFKKNGEKRLFTNPVMIQVGSRIV